MKNRVCDICYAPLAGKKRHGFVSLDGKSVICGDFKMMDGKSSRHQIIRRREKRGATIKPLGWEAYEQQ